MAAYCVVDGLPEKTPFVRFKTSTGDNSVVSLSPEGNGHFSIDEDGTLALPVVDPSLVFGDDMTLISPEAFLRSDEEAFVSGEGQTENKLPSAFSYRRFDLRPGEKKRFASVYGYWEDFASFQKAIGKLDFETIEEKRKENALLIEELLAPAIVKTNNPLYDEAIAQSYLDNSLRGGFPVLLDDGKKGTPYYVYGRKHGDMERDYNAFNIPAEYFSSGPGNFRDVNQNRRSDLFFAPYIGDYNIRLFFSLIQADGQNPLNVKPESFRFEEKELRANLNDLSEEEIAAIVAMNGFEPGSLYSYLRSIREEAEAAAIFRKILAISHQEVEANFAEGYWVDHWTYNVDLLENYLSVFPDRMEEMVFASGYRYFYSPVYVEPRSEKYVLRADGQVRQYGAIDLAGLKKTCEKRNFDLKKTAYLLDGEGKPVVTNLAGKLLNLILIKFSTLDSEQMGIEMECEKPGWNDAMNGLPGLFASGMSEAVELLRLVRFAREAFARLPEHQIPMMEWQLSFYSSLKRELDSFLSGGLDRFAYWDRATSLREALRLRYRDGGEPASRSLSSKEIIPLLERMDEILHDGILRAKRFGDGILPSYLLHEVSDYEVTDKLNHLGLPVVKVRSFTLKKIPPFLEASARALKLADGTIDRSSHEAIKKSGLHDPILHFYKTCADIDAAPFEIWRVHAFTKGWLERECNFLHMDYKYLLGLLRAGYYDLFYEEIKTNYVPFMDPEIYGRNPAEASSFIVPTCNPDASKHGQGFFARLTGANAEMLDMYVRLFAGDHVFSVVGGRLTLTLDPKLPSSWFKDGKVRFRLFGKVDVEYLNPKGLDLYKGGYSFSYVLDGRELESISGDEAIELRSAKNTHHLVVKVK